MTAKPINSGLILTVGLPLFAIMASLGAAVIAFTLGDPTLPDEYHWEGMSLDRDFAGAQRAFELNVHGTLRISSTDGICRLTLQLAGKAPGALRLTLVHATQPNLDRQIRLTRAGAVYAGACGSPPNGHWHLEIQDELGEWSVRQDVEGALDGAQMAARPGEHPLGG